MLEEETNPWFASSMFQMVIYDKPYFSGKSRTISTSMKDFMTRKDRQQTTFMYTVGSLKVLGGMWALFTLPWGLAVADEFIFTLILRNLMQGLHCVNCV